MSYATYPLCTRTPTATVVGVRLAPLRAAIVTAGDDAVIAPVRHGRLRSTTGAAAAVRTTLNEVGRGEEWLLRAIRMDANAIGRHRRQRIRLCARCDFKIAALPTQQLPHDPWS